MKKRNLFVPIILLFIGVLAIFLMAGTARANGRPSTHYLPPRFRNPIGQFGGQ